MLASSDSKYFHHFDNEQNVTWHRFTATIIIYIYIYIYMLNSMHYNARKRQREDDKDILMNVIKKVIQIEESLFD